MSKPELEIEQKFFVASPEVLIDALKNSGSQLTHCQWQSDEYFNHPCRDFQSTDEAFRIRYQGKVPAKDHSEAGDGSWWVTYKGPKEPAAVKIREEIELALCDSAVQYQQWKTMIEKLSFRYVATVEKYRENWNFPASEKGYSIAGKPLQTVLVTLDRVTGLGVFAEVELVTRREDLEEAQQVVLDVAQCLGLNQPTRQSYLRSILKLQEN